MSGIFSSIFISSFFSSTFTSGTGWESTWGCGISTLLLLFSSFFSSSLFSSIFTSLISWVSTFFSIPSFITWVVVVVVVVIVVEEITSFNSTFFSSSGRAGCSTGGTSSFLISSSFFSGSKLSGEILSINNSLFSWFSVNSGFLFCSSSFFGSDVSSVFGTSAFSVLFSGTVTFSCGCSGSCGISLVVSFFSSVASLIYINKKIIIIF